MRAADASLRHLIPFITQYTSYKMPINFKPPTKEIPLIRPSRMQFCQHTVIQLTGIQVVIMAGFGFVYFVGFLLIATTRSMI